eukprot:COSAG01_NODE_52322_length_347_cov_1.020161_1_plen_68_part_10
MRAPQAQALSPQQGPSPVLGCEYRAVRRAVVHSHFEVGASEQLGFLEPGDVVVPLEARPTSLRGRWRL